MAEVGGESHSVVPTTAERTLAVQDAATNGLPWFFIVHSVWKSRRVRNFTGAASYFR